MLSVIVTVDLLTLLQQQRRGHVWASLQQAGGLLTQLLRIYALCLPAYFPSMCSLSAARGSAHILVAESITHMTCTRMAGQSCAYMLSVK